MTMVTQFLPAAPTGLVQHGSNGRNGAKPLTPSPLTPLQQLLVEPGTVEATGLPREFLGVLILKWLHQGGIMEAHDLAARLCLRFNGVVEPILDELKRENLVEVKSGQHLNPASYRYCLTDKGSQHVRAALERNRYIGPCPVTLEQYSNLIKIQAVGRPQVGEAEVKQATWELVLSSDILECIGPAVNSFKSLFLYGPPGNGKSSIAKIIGRGLLGGEVWTPHAIFSDGQIIKVYDEATHRALTEPVRWEPFKADRRWVRCRPPVVTVGGELTLHDLDLAYNDAARFYEAPLQLKANGGMFLIDDFGRQQMPPKELLNRWIVPLEERVDYLTFHTGKKVAIPFETLIIFSTNLNPAELMDEAFLRRIRHKLGIDYPTAQQYYQIFRQVCQQRGLAFDQETFVHLVQNYYLAGNRPFQACHPRDLLDQLTDFAHYRREPVRMTVELMDRAARSYFARLF